eukprot:1155016-Pelagomonas_calceolata.AAC.3
MKLHLLESKEKGNLVGRGNPSYINGGKGDTLAQESREPPPSQNYKSKSANGDLGGIRSTQLQDLAVRNITVFNSAPSGNKLVGLEKKRKTT